MDDIFHNGANSVNAAQSQEDDADVRVCKILVMGIGGGGNNAVNRMIEAGITSADFVAANTDKQDLYTSQAPTCVVLGSKLTKGLGAGSDPVVGKKAAEESREIIKELLVGVDLLFIAAGMGGGTGTGAAPVVANIAKELGILTIAVVTTPFRFEGARRMTQAESGISELRQYVDTLLVVPNEKLLSVMPKGSKLNDAFKYADDVLRQGIQGIADLIVKPALINLDFSDVKTIMKEKGFAHIGIGVGEGEHRILDAVSMAVNNKLLDTNINEAMGTIINVSGGESLQADEVSEACRTVQQVLNPSANIIFGADINPELKDSVCVTIIATGFKHGGNTMRSSFTPSPIPPVSDGARRDAFDRNYHNAYTPKDDSYRENGGKISISDDDLPPFVRRLRNDK